MKLTIETIRQLIKEELQHIMEQPAPVKHSYREEFTNVAGWENAEKLHRLFQKPTDAPIVDVYANVFGKLYERDEMHFIKHSGENHKVFQTGECENKAPFEPEDSMLFDQYFLAYSTLGGFDALPSSHNFKTAGGFEVYFEGDEATELARSLGIPVDDAPNIPELSDFSQLPDNEAGESQWSYDGENPKGEYLHIKSPLIPIMAEKDGQKFQVQSCPQVWKGRVLSKPNKLGIRLGGLYIKMQKEPEEQKKSERVLMRATNKVETLRLQIDVISMK
jgi:hypothetical protein